jgi:hypothetical protein
MPPTVMTPRSTPCCGLCAVLVGLLSAEPLPPELGFAPAVFGAPVFAGAAEAVWPAGAAPLLVPCTPDGLPLLAGVGVPDVAPLLGVPAAGPLLGAGGV